jgi:hypothetical protein
MAEDNLQYVGMYDVKDHWQDSTNNFDSPIIKNLSVNILKYNYQNQMQMKQKPCLLPG